MGIFAKVYDLSSETISLRSLLLIYWKELASEVIKAAPTTWSRFVMLAVVRWRLSGRLHARCRRLRETRTEVSPARSRVKKASKVRAWRRKAKYLEKVVIQAAPPPKRIKGGALSKDEEAARDASGRDFSEVVIGFSSSAACAPRSSAYPYEVTERSHSLFTTRLSRRPGHRRSQ